MAAATDFRTTIKAFRAFADNRPDGEKWELIGGRIVETHSSTHRHQIIIGRLLFELETSKRATSAPWQCFMGIGSRVASDHYNEIVPDAMVMLRTNTVIDWTYDVLAAFEVTAPETFDNDMVHKRAFYARIQRLTHYVVLAQDRREATMFSRSNDFSPLSLKSAGAKIEIEPLGIAIPLADIYRDVPLG